MKSEYIGRILLDFVHIFFYNILIFLIWIVNIFYPSITIPVQYLIFITDNQKKKSQSWFIDYYLSHMYVSIIFLFLVLIFSSLHIRYYKYKEWIQILDLPEFSRIVHLIFKTYHVSLLLFSCGVLLDIKTSLLLSKCSIKSHKKILLLYNIPQYSILPYAVP